MSLFYNEIKIINKEGKVIGVVTEDMQIDWNQTDNTKFDFIKNKPPIKVLSAGEDNIDNLLDSGIYLMPTSPRYGTLPFSTGGIGFWLEIESVNPGTISAKQTITFGSRYAIRERVIDNYQTMTYKWTEWKVVDLKNQIQPDWSQSDSNADDYIKNKPDLSIYATDEMLNRINSALQDSVDNINSKIPTQASSENKLADKDFVNSSISTLTASFIGSFNTYSDLLNYDGSVSNNDYAVVLNDESHNGETWRYKYNASDSKWVPEYKVNDTPLTSEQLASLNSGSTKELINQITTNETNISNNTTQINDILLQLQSKQNNIVRQTTGWIPGTVNISDGMIKGWAYVYSESEYPKSRFPYLVAGKTYLLSYELDIPLTDTVVSGKNYFATGDMIGIRCNRNTNLFDLNTVFYEIEPGNNTPYTGARASFCVVYKPDTTQYISSQIFCSKTITNPVTLRFKIDALLLD